MKPRKFLRSPHPSTYGSLRIGQRLVLERNALLESDRIRTKGYTGEPPNHVSFNADSYTEKLRQEVPRYSILRKGLMVEITDVDLFSNITHTTVLVTVKILGDKRIRKKVTFGQAMLTGSYYKRNIAIDKTWWRILNG